MEDFGGLVRRRREELGLSQARVAELVGRAPGTVRAWERGHSVPADTAVLRSLAAVLALDEGELLACAGVHPPEERARLTVDEALASLADVLPGPVAEEEPVSGGDRLVPRGLGSERGSDEMASTGRAAAPGDVPGVSPAYPGSYLDDPEEKAIYRQRAMRTAVAIAVSALVGFLALRGFAVAIGAVWDVIAASL